jgi:hypothetical protein
VFIVLAISVVLVAGAALLATAAARPGSAISFVLGAYLVAWTELIAVALGLSLFDAVRSSTLVVGFAGAFVAALVLWYVSGTPAPPSFRPGLHSVRTALRDPPLAILGLLAAIVFVYAAALGILTAQNEWDALTYHLARAAFWAQQGRVGYIPNSIDVRLNGNPPNAEIGQLAALVLGGNERLVWMPQLGAALAATLAVAGIGRRIAFTVRESLFGAFVFATLPLIALQLSSALNDLVVAGFFTIGVYFGLGVGRRSAAAAALAVALGFGTKISAPLLLVIFVLALVAARRRPVLHILGIAVVGTLAGGIWYVVNLVNTGSLDGDLAQGAGQVADRGVVPIAWRAFRLMLDMFEVPGASGGNGLLYVACAVGFLVAGVVARLRRTGHPRALLIAAVTVVAVPTLVVLLARGLTDGWHRFWPLVGRGDIAETVPAFSTPTLSDSAVTWYGPLGVSLLVAGIVAAVCANGIHRRTRIVFASAPIVFIAVIAVGLTYDPWRGRFFVFSIALAASTWGSIYRIRGFTWAVAGLAATTAVLVLVQSNQKPPGVRLLDGPASRSVFGDARWSVQTRLRTTDGTRLTIRFVEDHVSPHVTMGLAVGGDDYVFPYFQGSLTRTIRMLPPGTAATPELDWIVEAPGREVPRCSASWRTEYKTSTGFAVLRRVSGDGC